jgi:hypothetical protein
VTIIGIMGLGIMICFRLKVETLIIPFRLIPLFLCFNLVQSPIFDEYLPKWNYRAIPQNA